jgi:hypothetical protein
VVFCHFSDRFSLKLLEVTPAIHFSKMEITPTAKKPLTIGLDGGWTDTRVFAISVPPEAFKEDWAKWRLRCTANRYDGSASAKIIANKKDINNVWISDKSLLEQQLLCSITSRGSCTYDLVIDCAPALLPPPERKPASLFVYQMPSKSYRWRKKGETEWNEGELNLEYEEDCILEICRTHSSGCHSQVVEWDGPWNHFEPEFLVDGNELLMNQKLKCWTGQHSHQVFVSRDGQEEVQLNREQKKKRKKRKRYYSEDEDEEDEDEEEEEEKAWILNESLPRGSLLVIRVVYANKAMKIEKKHSVQVPSAPPNFNLSNWQKLFKKKQKVRIETIDPFDSDSSSDETIKDLRTVELTSQGFFHFYEITCSYGDRGWKKSSKGATMQGTFRVGQIEDAKKCVFAILLQPLFCCNKKIQWANFSDAKTDPQLSAPLPLQMQDILKQIFEHIINYKHRCQLRLVCKLWAKLIENIHVMDVEIPDVYCSIIEKVALGSDHADRWEIVRVDRPRKKISPHWEDYEDSPDPSGSDVEGTLH